MINIVFVGGNDNGDGIDSDSDDNNDVYCADIDLMKLLW